MEGAARAVEARRLALLDRWVAEGSATSLDVGKLRFTDAEARDALARPPGAAVRYLDDPRWFHALDKGYRGRAVHDPTGLAADLARWLTDARFAPAVVQARQAAHWRQVRARRAEAAAALAANDGLAAAIALRESLHALMRALIERWGERDTSWARFGARFERTAAARGAGDLARGIMALYELTPEQVAWRLARAPQGIQERHRLSFAARQLAGEPVTAAQDARDVLLVFGTLETRQHPPPYAAWVGLETEPRLLARHLTTFDYWLRSLDAAKPDETSAQEDEA